VLHYTYGEFEESLADFESAFSIIKDENENDYFHAVAAALRIGKETKAGDLIKNAIYFKNANKVYFENFDGFDIYRNTETLISVHKNYDEYSQEYRNQLKHPAIYDEIEAMMEADQAVRDGNSSTEDMVKQDSLNIDRLIEITKEHGWQEKSWLMLWHQRGNHTEDNYIWNYFRPVIDSLIVTCEIRKDYWVQFEEHNAIFSTGNQIYGMFWRNYDSYPLHDVENVDKRRDSVGLAPLCYMHEVYNANLTEGYVKPIKP